MLGFFSLDVLGSYADCLYDLLGETKALRRFLHCLGQFFKVKFVVFVVLPNQCD